MRTCLQAISARRIASALGLGAALALAGLAPGANADPAKAGGEAAPVVRAPFDWKDEAAALEAVQVALTEVGDGSTYVWYRAGGRLSGAVQPTQSFEDVSGRVCRHILIMLNDAGRTARTEGIACRLVSGVWQLDG